MKRTLPFLAGGALFCFAFAALDQLSEFKSFVTAMNMKIAKAFDNKDTKFFDSISTPDFTIVERGQTINRRQAMDEMKHQFAQTKTMTCSIKVLSVKLNGNTGTVATQGHAIIHPKNMNPKDKKDHVITMDFWETQTWVKSGKTWKISKLVETKPSKMMMDGKPMAANGMG